MRFTGFPLALLLAHAQPLAAARFVRFEAWSPRRHDTSLPLELAARDTWLVHGYDGRPLTPEHGFPLRSVTPSRYFYKSLKWVHRIELLEADQLGYWERESSYHPIGDPRPGDQRFTTGSLAPEKLARLRQAKSLAPYRGPAKVLIGADLGGWNPLDRDLHDLHLKHCDLRGARLAGVDLRRANLSLSDLRDADLAGADLRQADVEGADFSGADLRGADLRDASLTATRFFTPGDDAAKTGARVQGLRLAGATGLLEDQEVYLGAHGADPG